MKLEKKGNGWLGRFRCGKGPRVRVTILAPDEATAHTRAARLRSRVDSLVAAGMPGKAAELLAEAASQRTERAFAGFERAMRDVAIEALTTPAPSGPRTFQDVLDLWLSGDVRRRWPNACRHKGQASIEQARGMYSRHIHPVLGPMPIVDITLEDAERVSARLGKLAQPSRRRYQLIIKQVLELAVYPLRLRESSPIPRKFVESDGARREFGWLYPDEEAQLIGHQDTDLLERFFFGFLSRNGLRVNEGIAAVWGDADLKRGAFTLNRNKTDAPRMWALDADVVEALTWLRETRDGDVEDTDLIFPGVVGDITQVARRLRRLLVDAKVTRRDLHTPTGNRRRLRAHDLRATFCTLALADGRSDQWVMQRTGHTTSAMLERYRRPARSVRELELGWFAPLPTALKLDSLPLPLRSRAVENPAGGGASMCSATVQSVGQKVGHEVFFQPKKARVRTPARAPLDVSRYPQDAETPAICAPSVPGAPGALDSGPPEIGGLGQTTDPVARRILTDAITRATAAEQWATVARLALILDGSAPAAATGV